MNKILQYMQTAKLIENEDVELYRYGIHLLFLKLVHYCSILALGFFLGRIGELLIFLTCYSVLRSYTGGYHAKQSSTCLLLSIIMIFFLHLSIDVIPDFVVIVTVMLSIIVILIDSLLKSKEKPIEEDEIVHNRKISVFLTMILSSAFLLFYITNLDKVYLPICYSLFYTSFFLFIPLWMKEKGRTADE